MNGERLSREKFIRAGARLGAALALLPTAAATLSSCGGDPSGDTGQTTDSPESPEATTRATTVEEDTAEQTSESAEETAATEPPPDTEPTDAIASASDVPPGSATEFEDAGEPAVLVHLESGKFVAYSAVCTHRGCAVAYDDGSLACPCHGSVFDPANGAAVVSGPATAPLAEIPLTERDGSITRA